MRQMRVVAAALLAVACLGCGERADAPETAAATPPPPAASLVALPPSGFRVEWGKPGVPCDTKPGAVFAVGVLVTNASDQVWVDPSHADAKVYASGAVRLAARWWGSDPKRPYRDYGAERGEMQGPVRPGKTAVMAIAVTAPTEPGNYKLQLDLVQENVSWFETRGAPVLMVPVVVKADTDTPKPRGSRG